MDDRSKADLIVESMGRLLAASSKVKKGTIASSSGRVATVALADGTEIEVRALDHVTLTNGRACWVLIFGYDALLLGTVAP